MNGRTRTSEVRIAAPSAAPPPLLPGDRRGRSARRSPRERLEVIEGVEIDYSSNELGGVLLGVLKGNGNFLERFLSGFAMSTGPGFDELVPVIRRSLSSRVARHYAGFGTQQREEWKKGGMRSAKKLLYVLRTTLVSLRR